MAEKRMFSLQVIGCDDFKEMPLSAQALYFHLGMNADDEGFLNNAKSVKRSILASDDDMKLLIAKGFIIQFESGVVAIRHWKVNNQIQTSRIKPSQCIEEKRLLEVKEDKTYDFSSGLNSNDDTCIDDTSAGQQDTDISYHNTECNSCDNICQQNDNICCQNVSKCEQDESECWNSIDKIRLDKDSIDKSSIDTDNTAASSGKSAGSRAAKAPKKKYGEYKHVLLTAAEYEKLTADYGEDIRDKAIKYLDEYIAEKAYRSKSHYLAIRRWVIDAVTNHEARQYRSGTNGAAYDPGRNRVAEQLDRSYEMMANWASSG